jgi:hypothetical protein
LLFFGERLGAEPGEVLVAHVVRGDPELDREARQRPHLRRLERHLVEAQHLEDAIDPLGLLRRVGHVAEELGRLARQLAGDGLRARSDQRVVEVARGDRRFGVAGREPVASPSRTAAMNTAKTSCPPVAASGSFCRAGRDERGRSPDVSSRARTTSKIASPIATRSPRLIGVGSVICAPFT